MLLRPWLSLADQGIYDLLWERSADRGCETDTREQRHCSYLLEVRGDAQRLVPKPEVGGDCDAAFADHGHDGPSVVFHYRLGTFL